MKIYLQIITILSTISYVSSTLQLYSPTCAVKLLNTNFIEYTLSNFGTIPYGQMFVGSLYYPKNQYLCSIQQQVQLKSDPKDRAFILIKRGGNCRFTQKVLNAQKLGAQVAIIYDNQTSHKPDKIMKNDGHARSIQILSVFISNDAGQALKKTKQCNETRRLKFQIMVTQTKISNVTFWLDANSRQSYVLIRDFYNHRYYQILKDKMNLKIVHRIDNQCHEWFCGFGDCFALGPNKFCRNTKKPIEDVKYPTGQTIIVEQIRQHVLWELVKNSKQHELWWKYMIQFDQQDCIERDDVRDCSIQTMRKVQISEKTIKDVHTQQYSILQHLDQDTDQNVLKTTYVASKQYDINFYPQAVVNQQTYYGLFRSGQVFQMICKSLIDPPSECINYINKKIKYKQSEESSGILSTILYILLFMTIAFIIALGIYTCIIKKQVNQQLSLQVNKLVQNYVNMTTKQKSNNDPSYSKFDQKQ